MAIQNNKTQAVISYGINANKKHTQSMVSVHTKHTRKLLHDMPLFYFTKKKFMYFNILWFFCFPIIGLKKKQGWLKTSVLCRES